MKLSALIAVLATAAAGVAGEPNPSTTENLKEKTKGAVEATKDTARKAAGVVSETTREAWKKTKAYFSEEPSAYREAATKRLNEIAADIEELKRAAGGAPPYFATRLKALEQHHKHAVAQLADIGPDVKRGKGSKRSQFDDTLDRLDDQLDLARREHKDFAPKND
ncbi:MAG: hypothetical protein ACR2OZ_10955 [Verrucomicrobiales bacterium]